MDEASKIQINKNKSMLKEIFCILGQLILAWVAIDIIKLLFVGLIALIEIHIPGFLSAAITLIILLFIVNAD